MRRRIHQVKSGDFIHWAVAKFSAAFCIFSYEVTTLIVVDIWAIYDGPDDQSTELITQSSSTGTFVGQSNINYMKFITNFRGTDTGVVFSYGICVPDGTNPPQCQ